MLSHYLLFVSSVLAKPSRESEKIPHGQKRREESGFAPQNRIIVLERAFPQQNNVLPTQYRYLSYIVAFLHLTLPKQNNTYHIFYITAVF